MNNNYNLKQIAIELKEGIQLESLISEYSTLKRSGTQLKCLCPIHSESQPSFFVSPEKQVFYCFGCGAGGDAIEFVKLVENIDFYQALIYLDDKFNLKIFEKYSDQNSTYKSISYIYEINEILNQYFVENVNSIEAKKYLENRKISNEIVKYFSIGYCPTDNFKIIEYLHKMFSAEEIQLAKIGFPELQQAGRITFPIRDIYQRINGFTGRTLSNAPNSRKYLNTGETPVFKKSTLLYNLDKAFADIKRLKKVYVCEGVFDAISLYQKDIANVVATLSGTPTGYQYTKLRKYTENIIICLDNDEASKRNILNFLEKNPHVFSESELRIIHPPNQVKDFGELLNTSEMPETIVEVNHFNWYVDKLGYKYDLTNVKSYNDYLKKVYQVITSAEQNIALHLVEIAASVISIKCSSSGLCSTTQAYEQIHKNLSSLVKKMPLAEGSVPVKKVDNGLIEATNESILFTFYLENPGSRNFVDQLFDNNNCYFLKTNYKKMMQFLRNQKEDYPEIEADMNILNDFVTSDRYKTSLDFIKSVPQEKTLEYIEKIFKRFEEDYILFHRKQHRS